MKLISLALIDDQPIVVEGLTHVFGAQDTFEVVATGATARDARAIAERFHPELMILGLSPSDGALQAISEIKAAFPSIKILMFTADPGVEHAVKALEAGALGYVSKSCQLDELLHAARAAITGETYISRNFASRVLTALRGASMRKVTVEALKLSAREDQIVCLLLDGKTNREMSLNLGITERTVKHYMTVLMQKLNARNRVEVVIAAQSLGRPAVSASGTRRSGLGRLDQQYAAGDSSYLS